MGRKARRILAILTIGACLPGIWLSARRLPLQTQDLIEKKYAGWSGVLRVWACEDWTEDGLTGWLNRCGSLFEKAHSGVYVEVKSVTPSALAAWQTFGAQPPDMILFPPGALDAADGLAEVDCDALRPALQDCGQGYAIPIALGGYAWAVNPDAEGIAVPPDEPGRCWSKAVQTLDAPGSASEESEMELPGIDLGLPAMSLSEVERREDALKGFIGGEIGAVAVSRKEIRRLESLSGQGKGPDWHLEAGGAPWTDLVVYLGIRSEGGEKEMLCREYLTTLLSEDCQSTLSKWDFFSVTEAPSGYGRADAGAVPEGALRGEGLTLAGAFGG